MGVEVYKKPAPNTGRLAQARKDWSTVYWCMETDGEHAQSKMDTSTDLLSTAVSK